MSIKKKLIIILSGIFLLFVFLGGKILWDARRAHLGVHRAEATLAELRALMRTRSAMVLQISRAMDYLLLPGPGAKQEYEENGRLVREARTEWSASVEKWAAVEGDATEQRELLRRVETLYDKVLGFVSDAHALADAGIMGEAYTILEETVERWINHVLTKEIDVARGIEMAEANESFDEILTHLGSLPWGGGRAVRHVGIARSSLVLYIRLHLLHGDISIQIRELVDYLVSGMEREIGEYEEHGLDATSEFRAWSEALEELVKLDATWAREALERAAELQRQHETFGAMAADVIAARGREEVDTVQVFAEKKLYTFIDNVLLAGISRELELAEADIRDSMDSLQRLTTAAGLEGVGVAGLVLGLLGVAVVSLARGVIRPLGALTEATEMIAEGRLEHRVRMETDDELGRLGQSFDYMVEALQESREEVVGAKEYTEQILATMYDMLIVVSDSGEILTANEAARRLLGYQEEELIGQPVGTVIEGGMALGGTGVQCDLGGVARTFLAKDGRTLPVSLSSAVMQNDAGEIEGVVCVAQDMTQRLAEEATRKRLGRRLALSEKMSAVSQLAAGLAHEIRNPLAAIDINTRNLEDAVCSGDGERSEAEKYFAMIFSELGRLNALLEKFVRSVVPHEPDTKPARCNLEEVVQSALQRIQRPLEAKRGELRFVSAQHPLAVEGFSEQLTQAFTNILQNAVDATPEGGTVRVEMRQVGSHAVVAVLDEGGGIASEDMARIFDFYFSTKQSGLGVGLPFSKLTVEQHDGTIEVVSEPGKGSCVTVRLPLKECTAHA